MEISPFQTLSMAKLFFSAKISSIWSSLLLHVWMDVRFDLLLPGSLLTLCLVKSFLAIFPGESLDQNSKLCGKNSASITSSFISIFLVRICSQHLGGQFPWGAFIGIVEVIQRFLSIFWSDGRSLRNVGHTSTTRFLLSEIEGGGRILRGFMTMDTTGWKQKLGPMYIILYIILLKRFCRLC